MAINENLSVPRTPRQVWHECSLIDSFDSDTMYAFFRYLAILFCFRCSAVFEFGVNTTTCPKCFFCICHRAPPCCWHSLMELFILQGDETQRLSVDTDSVLSRLLTTTESIKQTESKATRYFLQIDCPRLSETSVFNGNGAHLNQINFLGYRCLVFVSIISPRMINYTRRKYHL